MTILRDRTWRVLFAVAFAAVSVLGVTEGIMNEQGEFPVFSCDRK